MKLVHTNLLPDTTTSHKGIFKKNILQNGYTPKLTGFSRVELSQGQEIEPHVHKTMYETYYVISGKLKLVVNNIEYFCGEGDSFTIEPNEIHLLKNEFSDKVEFVYFGIATE